MKKHLLFCVLCLMAMTQLVTAGPIDGNAARQRAVTFMNGKVGSTRGALSGIHLSTVRTEFSHLYIFNVQGGGFVIVSDDDRTMPVLGYSTTGSIEAGNMAPGLVNQLEKYNAQLKAIAEGAEVTPYTPHRNLRSVSPLIQTHWEQYSTDGSSYNSMCPIDSGLQSTGYRPATGCVATAAAQVMKYWNWPLHGRGSNCYSHDYECWHYGTLCADFESTTYDWDNMPNSLDGSSTQAERDAIGLLQYHCGVAMNMQYNLDCYSSSGAQISGQYGALVNSFRYSYSARHLERSNFSDNEWLALLKNDLDDSLPVLYSGQAESGGHAFIFDGYDENDMVHVNWGWGGGSDGYYSIFSLTPAAGYDYSHNEQAILGLRPEYNENSLSLPLQCCDVRLDTNILQLEENVRGHVDFFNPNDTVISFFVAQALFVNPTYVFDKWIDVQRVTIPARDTVHYSFDAPVNKPIGCYYTNIFFSMDTIDINSSSTSGAMQFPSNYYPYGTFWVVDSNRSSLVNLVVFIRFSNDMQISQHFNSIDSMFNCKAPDYHSVYNYFDASTYGNIHYNTRYAGQVSGNSIHAYRYTRPRAYFLPYSNSNLNGYQDDVQTGSVSKREAELLAAAIKNIRSSGNIGQYDVFDGDGDGFIDNVTFIIKGDIDESSPILTPHQNIFPQDSVDQPVQLNGKLLHSFCVNFEAASPETFKTAAQHGLLYSLDVPYLYHTDNYLNVSPTSLWDMMGNPYVMSQTNMMFKSKYLHVAEPIQITEDGTYTLYSNATSAEQSCYFIKSAKDSSQWFTFEFRNKEDLFDNGIPETGLVIGRWNSNVALNGNALFDNAGNPHQYWVFRPGSDSDIENGDVSRMCFSTASGRTSFGPATDPHPYLADGTPENSFEITEIQEYGDHLTFRVTFRNSLADSSVVISAYPNPTADHITVTGTNMQRLDIYNGVGQLLMSETATDPTRCTLSVNNLTLGYYIIKVTHLDGTENVVKFVKE